MDLVQERELLQRIQADPKEFGALFDLYYKPIFGYLYRRTGQYALSKDMAAETFLKAFLKISAFVSRDVSISSWLYRIATNEANQYFRKNRYRPQHLHNSMNPEVLNQPDLETERQALEDELSAHEDFLLIRDKLKTLKIGYQEVISLRYFENKSSAEIGIILGKPEGTIRSLLSRGLEQLRELVIH